MQNAVQVILALSPTKSTSAKYRTPNEPQEEPEAAAMDPTVDHLDKPTSDGDQPKESPSAAESKSSLEIPSPPPPPPPADHKSVSWSRDLTSDIPPAESKSTVETVKNVLVRWRSKVGDTTKKAEDLGRNVWQHLKIGPSFAEAVMRRLAQGTKLIFLFVKEFLNNIQTNSTTNIRMKTGPSFAEAAMGRLAQGTKVIAEGGYEKIFRQTFDLMPEEELKNTYACYLSTSAGPVMGILYLSTAKLAFCSDNPLPYKDGDRTEWSYYKVVIPLIQLRSANPSLGKANPAEKYIQVVSVDNHEFWFMGFFSYDGALNSLQEALHNSQDSQA